MKKTLKELHLTQLELGESYISGVNEYAIISKTDILGNILEINENFCKISGFTKEELIGETHRIINSGHHPKSFWKECWSTIRSGKNWRGEVKNRAKDGSYYWVDTTISPLLNSNREIVGFLSIRYDITAHKKSEEELEDTVNQLKSFVTNLPAAVAMFDKELCYLAHSNKWIDDYQLEGKDIIGKCHYDIFPTIPCRWKEHHRLALEGQYFKQNEDKFITENGVVWLSWDVRPWFDRSGEIGGIMMLTEVITDKKMKELELDLIFKNTEMGIWKLDPKTEKVEWNDSMYQLYELDKVNFEVTLERWMNLVATDIERERVNMSFKRALDNPNQFEFYEIFKANTGKGKAKYISVKASIERDENGLPVNIMGININQSKEVTDQKMILEMNQYLDLALEGANLGIWDWYIESGEVCFDKRWGDMLGIPFDELKHELMTWESRVHPDDLEKAYEDIQNYLTGKTDKYENIHRMKHSDGHWVYILDHGKISERNSDGKPIRFTGTHFDITAQKEQELEIIRAKEKAELAEKVKSEFLANMSHELRSPMNGILGMVELMGGNNLSSDQLEMLTTIKTCGESLLVILNDILDLSKIESNKIELEEDNFDLKQCLKEIVFLYTHQAHEKGIELTSNEKDFDAIWLSGDVTRLRQVLINLISNAIKFTSKGYVDIKLEILSSYDSKIRFKVEVRDSGVGIPKESQSKLFESFTQADSSITRKFGGTGLGLSISRQLMKLMGGDIYFTSEEGVGSCFTIDLSLKSGHAGDDKSITTNHQKLYENLDLKILLVEDNLINQKVAIKMLAKLGYECKLANNGEEALNIIDNLGADYFDIVLMDMQMPVMDGVSATKLLKEKYGDDTPYIIAMTANVFDTDKKKCMDAGMSDFITKPVKLDSLESSIRNSIQKKIKAS